MMKNSRRTFKQWSAAFLTLCMLAAAVPVGATGTEYISPQPDTGVPEGSVDTTPATYKFTVDGKGFVLLDNDESTYYVTTTDAYGDMETISDSNMDGFENPTGKQINYDAYKSDTFLNGAFLTSGNNFTSSGNDATTYYKLPQGIIDNIDTTHVWKRFVNDYRSGNGMQSKYTTGASLLSWTDFTTYAGKLGVRDVFNDPNVASTAGKYYYLRDSNAWGGDSAVLMFGDYKDETKDLVNATVYGNQWVMKYGLLRPAFYLKKDFFKTTKVDLSTAGETVRMAILNACTETELSKLYTEEERSTYFGSKSPIKVTTAVRSGAELADVKLLDTLTASVSEGEATEYKWQTRTNESDKWTEIDGATSNEYIVSAAQAGKQVSCAAKVDGVWIYGEAVQIPMYEAVETGDGTAVPAGTIDTTAASDKFTVDGKEFVLLDTFDNDESTYYVTTTDAYGDMQLKTDGKWWTLSGKEINYDAYSVTGFLNVDFLTNGNNFTELGNDTTTYYKLPQGIIDNINQNHVWWRFVNETKKGEGVKSTYQAGVSFLSWTDFTTYAGKLGVKDGCFNSSVANADTYFLRDTNNWRGDNALALFCTTDNQCKHWGQYVRQYGLVRPAFYLKKDFFKNTKLDLNATGENVLAVMRDNYYIEDLLHLYSMQELCEKGFDTRNYAMKASLTYSDAENNPLDSLNNAAKVNAAVTIENGTSEEKSAILIFRAVDSKNGLYVSTKSVTVAANGETPEEISLDGLENMTDGCQVNVFLWESFDTLKPMTQSLTYGQSSSAE
ncbi:MAG: hypothetical protein PUF72_03520 [Clostridiales bacterium]|nr:hypothetical protein [Clostridiales bacterium]